MKTNPNQAPQAEIECRFLLEPATKPTRKDSRKIGGMGIVFNRESRLMFDFSSKRLFVEEIKPEAVRRAMGKTSELWVDYDHTPSQLLGTAWAGTARFNITDEGVEYEADVPDTTYGNDLLALTERGDIKGSSFVFITNEEGDKWERVERFGMKIWKRTVHDMAKIISMGPVFGEAYPDTNVAKRSLEEWEAQHPEESERSTPLEGGQGGDEKPYDDTTTTDDDNFKTPTARSYSPDILRLVFQG